MRGRAGEALPRCENDPDSAANPRRRCFPRAKALRNQVAFLILNGNPISQHGFHGRTNGLIRTLASRKDFHPIAPISLTNIIAIDRDQENSGIRCRIYRGWRRTSEVTCFLWSGSGSRRRPLELFRYRWYNYVSVRQDDCEKQMFDPAVSGISNGNEPMRDGLLAKFNGFDGAVVRPLMKAQHPPHGAIYYFLTA
jgi:hypothetical protein